MKFNNHKFGFIYNIRDFNIEKYWKRTEEKYNKKMELLNSLKESEIKEIEEREKKKKEIENIKDDEKRQNEMFKGTSLQKSLNMQKENQELENEILKIISKDNLFKDEKKKLKPIFKSSFKNVLSKENNRYETNGDLPNCEKQGKNPNNGVNCISKDKFPKIPQTYESLVLPIIPEVRGSLQIEKK